MPKVYVLNRHGRPLMPCTPAKARHLLDAGKAKVRHRTPFTIQLLYGSTGYTQEVILGVDAGSKTIGLSAATETEELFSAEVKPRNDVVELMSARRQFRRARRNRTTRYRKPRFDNRVRSKHKGWLAPSVEVKIQEHMTAIRRACAILPVSKVVVETAEFDLQLLKAVAEGKPVPQGEDYQKGEMYGHYNVRQYVLWRDSYTCCICGVHGSVRKGVPLHVHHLESRRVGGDAPDNLVTLCTACHDKLHKGIIMAADIKKRKRRSTRDATFMGIMRMTLLRRLREQLPVAVVETRGLHHQGYAGESAGAAEEPCQRRAGNRARPAGLSRRTPAKYPSGGPTLHHPPCETSQPSAAQGDHPEGRCAEDQSGREVHLRLPPLRQGALQRYRVLCLGETHQRLLPAAAAQRRKGQRRRELQTLKTIGTQPKLFGCIVREEGRCSSP